MNNLVVFVFVDNFHTPRFMFVVVEEATATKIIHIYAVSFYLIVGMAALTRNPAFKFL